MWSNFDEAVGKEIEAIRTGRYTGPREVWGLAPELSPEDLAAAAREVGIPWRRGTVRAIETGNRKLWASEFVLLGEIFRRAWARKDFYAIADLADFIPEDPVTVGTVRVPGVVLKRVLGGDPMSPKAITQLPPDERQPGAAASRLQARRSLPLDQLPERLDLDRLGREARGDAEIKLARKLRTDPEAVVIAAHRLWGVGLTEKRDHELGHEAGKGKGAIAQRRGRVTLRLGRELAEEARSVHRLLTDASHPAGPGRIQ